MSNDIEDLKETLGERFKELEIEGDIETAREAVKTINSLEQVGKGETLSVEQLREKIKEDE